MTMEVGDYAVLTRNDGKSEVVRIVDAYGHYIMDNQGNEIGVMMDYDIRFSRGAEIEHVLEQNLRPARIPEAFTYRFPWLAGKLFWRHLGSRGQEVASVRPVYFNVCQTCQGNLVDYEWFFECQGSCNQFVYPNQPYRMDVTPA